MKNYIAKKDGGLLIALIVAMVAVGVLAAASVRLLRSQSITRISAYNQLRARYAADSCKSFLDNLYKNGQLHSLTNFGTLTYTLENGDTFSANLQYMTNYFVATIFGKMLNGANTMSTRLMTAKYALLSSPGPTPDGKTPVVVNPVGQVEEDTGGMAQAEVNVVVDSDIKFNEINNFVPNGDGRRKNNYLKTLNLHEAFKTDTLYTSRGRSTTKLRTDLNIGYAELDPADSSHLAWSVALPLDYATEAAAARVANATYLAYDVQTKVSWQRDGNDFNRETGASGLAFKFHGTADAGYQFLAVTLMKYRNENETGNLLTTYDTVDFNVINGYSANDGYWGTYDGIPNDIKPPGKANRLLLVLWKQWVDANGDIQRTWLMSQDLTTQNDFINQYDGLIDATLQLRVLEGTDSTGEFIDVTCYAGDAIWWHSDAFWFWLADNNPYNRRWNRRPYFNADDNGSAFVKWPPPDMNDWSQSTDYFTLTQGSASVTLNSGVTQLADGHTFRIYESDFLSRNQQDIQGELAFIACGNFLSGATNLEKKPKNFTPENEVIDSLWMAFDDLSIRWLLTDSGASSSGSGGIIITGF